VRYTGDNGFELVVSEEVCRVWKKGGVGLRGVSRRDKSGGGVDLSGVWRAGGGWKNSSVVSWEDRVGWIDECVAV